MPFLFPMMHRGLGLGGLVAGFICFLVVLALILLVVRLIAGPRRAWWHAQAMAASVPLEIAKARYAKGEIDKAQFEQIKKDIS